MNRVFIGGMVVLFWGAASAPANAFCRAATCGDACIINATTGCAADGQPIAWMGSCVSYSVHRDGNSSVSHDQLAEATDLAFRTWWETTCPNGAKPPTLTVRDFFGEAWCDRAEYNQGQSNANIIAFRDPWEGERNMLAITTVTTNKETGEILDADMEINGMAPLSAGVVPVAGKYDLQSIITHEAGHFLGLAHSRQMAATMSSLAQMPGTDDLRTLDVDDIAGMCAIYPPDRNPPACDATPVGGFSPECKLDPVIGGNCSLAVPQAGAPNGAITAVVLGLGVAVARPRRRRRVQKLA